MFEQKTFFASDSLTVLFVIRLFFITICGTLGVGVGRGPLHSNEVSAIEEVHVP